MNAPTAWTERCRLLAEPVIEACTVTPVSAGPAALAREIGKHLPDWSFREVLCRGGWYRLGGVVGESGSRIAVNLEQWVTDALEERGDDLTVLLEDYAESGLRATHLTGRTHYFVAASPQGGSTDFLQLEIEDLQETYAQTLFNRDPAPTTVDELVDARCSPANDDRCGMPIGTAHYQFRRLVHVGDVLAKMRTQSLDAQPIHRFVTDWDASSAGPATAFSNHWAMALREHLDRYQQTLIRATPVPAYDSALPRFTAREGTAGLSLHSALTTFDRALGYPMAWYFSLITGKAHKAIPHWVPAAVASDAVAGFSYLPERDLAVVKQWLHKPYTF